MKKITILLPCYNSGQFIEQSVLSAIQQNYENYDIHAYDNGSTDGSLDFLRYIEETNENFTLHEVPNIYKNSFREAVDDAFQNIDTDGWHRAELYIFYYLRRKLFNIGLH